MRIDWNAGFWAGLIAGVIDELLLWAAMLMQGVSPLAGMPMAFSVRRMAVTASPSEPPRGTLKEIVLAGNWLRWLMSSGCWRTSTFTLRACAWRAQLCRASCTTR